MPTLQEIISNTSLDSDDKISAMTSWFNDNIPDDEKESIAPKFNEIKSRIVIAPLIERISVERPELITTETKQSKDFLNRDITLTIQDSTKVAEEVNKRISLVDNFMADLSQKGGIMGALESTAETVIQEGAPESRQDFFKKQFSDTKSRLEKFQEILNQEGSGVNVLKDFEKVNENGFAETGGGAGSPSIVEFQEDVFNRLNLEKDNFLARNKDVIAYTRAAKEINLDKDTSFKPFQINDFQGNSTDILEVRKKPGVGRIYQAKFDDGSIIDFKPEGESITPTVKDIRDVIDNNIDKLDRDQITAFNLNFKRKDINKGGALAGEFIKSFAGGTAGSIADLIGAIGQGANIAIQGYDPVNREEADPLFLRTFQLAGESAVPGRRPEDMGFVESSLTTGVQAVGQIAADVLIAKGAGKVLKVAPSKAFLGVAGARTYAPIYKQAFEQNLEETNNPEEANTLATYEAAAVTALSTLLEKIPAKFLTGESKTAILGEAVRKKLMGDSRLQKLIFGAAEGAVRETPVEVLQQLTQIVGEDLFRDNGALAEEGNKLKEFLTEGDLKALSTSQVYQSAVGALFGGGTIGGVVSAARPSDQSTQTPQQPITQLDGTTGTQETVQTAQETGTQGTTETVPTEQPTRPTEAVQPTQEITPEEQSLVSQAQELETALQDESLTPEIQTELQSELDNINTNLETIRQNEPAGQTQPIEQRTDTVVEEERAIAEETEQVVNAAIQEAQDTGVEIVESEAIQGFVNRNPDQVIKNFDESVQRIRTTKESGFTTLPQDIADSLVEFGRRSIGKIKTGAEFVNQAVQRFGEAVRKAAESLWNGIKEGITNFIINQTPARIQDEPSLIPLRQGTRALSPESEEFLRKRRERLAAEKAAQESAQQPVSPAEPTPQTQEPAQKPERKPLSPENQKLKDEIIRRARVRIANQQIQEMRAKEAEDAKSKIPEGKERGFVERTKEFTQFENESKNIENDPRSYYEPQTYEEINKNIQNMTDEQLIKALTDTGRIKATEESNDNLGILAGIERINRGIAKGEDVSDVYQELAQKGTTIGQLLRQFGELKNSTAEGIAQGIEKRVEDQNRTLTDTQKKNLREIADTYLKDNRAYKDSLKEAEKSFTDKNLDKANEDRKKAVASYTKLVNFSDEIIPRQGGRLLEQIMQGNLLTPMSQVSNILGNVSLLPLRSSTKAIASTTDAIIAYVLNKPRTTNVGYRQAKAYLEGAKIGTGQAFREILTGTKESSFAKGEIERGFRPLRALVQAFSGSNLPRTKSGRIALNDRLKKFIEGTFGIPAELMFRFLNLGDKPFIRATEKALTEEYAKNKGLSEQEAKKLWMFPNKELKKILDTEGKEAVFAQDNKLADLVNYIFGQLERIPLIGSTLRFIAKTQAPYTKFPSNFILETIDYAVPLVSLTKALYHSAQGNRRKALISLGKFGVGTIIGMVGEALAELNITSPGADKDDEKATNLQYDTLPPFGLNISALNRFLKGESFHLRNDDKIISYDSDDKIISYDKLGIIGSILAIQSEKVRQLRKTAKRQEKPPANNVVDFVLNSLQNIKSTAAYSFDQSWLKGAAGLMQALTEQDKKGETARKNWMANTFKTISSIAIPNTVDAFARANQEYIPEARGETAEESIANVIKIKLLQDQSFPAKVNMWGERIKRTPKGANPYVHSLFDVTKLRLADLDDVNREIYSIYLRTYDSDVIPSIPTDQFRKYGKTYNLTAKEDETLKELVGKERHRRVELLLTNKGFKDAKDEVKIKILQKQYDQARDYGINIFLNRTKKQPSK